MKTKRKPASRIPMTNSNTNKKKSVDVQVNDTQKSKSPLMKNEFALILLGALLLTIIIFFLFFRSAGSKNDTALKTAANPSVVELENRVKALEQALKLQSDKITSTTTTTIGTDKKTKNNIVTDPMRDRVTRLETVLSVKFESLIERMEKIEKQLNRRPVATISAKPVKATAKAQKKAVQKKTIKKTSLFHTVKKGETLYSIGKKYSVSITDLRRLNNLTKTAKIYPGNNILVR